MAGKNQYIHPTVIRGAIFGLFGGVTFLAVNGDLPVDPDPMTLLAVLAIVAAILAIGMVAYKVFKPSAQIDAAQTLGNSNSTIPPVHPVKG